MITLAYNQFQELAKKGLKGLLGAGQQAELILRFQQNLPDFRPWVGPFAALTVIGLLLGLLTVVSFQRFRGVMNG